jgi:tetratricopeptide (TPR) repeat protein
MHRLCSVEEELAAIVTKGNSMKSGIPLRCWVAALTLAISSAHAQTEKPAISSPSHYQKGYDQLQAANYEGAAISFERALSKKPDNALGQFYYAQALEKLNRFTEALLHYQKSVFVDPNSTVAAQARLRIASLNKPSAPPAVPAQPIKPTTIACDWAGFSDLNSVGGGIKQDPSHQVYTVCDQCSIMGGSNWITTADSYSAKRFPDSFPMQQTIRINRFDGSATNEHIDGAYGMHIEPGVCRKQENQVM